MKTLSLISQVTGKLMKLCEKRIKGQAKEVTPPHLIGSYNKAIGGVDLMDRLLESYRPTVRGKMVLDPVHKLSQLYSCCSMEDILPTWPAKGISSGVSETDNPLLV